MTVEALNVKCPECGIRIDLDLKLIGALCHCQQCHSNFVAPSTPIAGGAVVGDFWVQKKLGGSRHSEVFLAKRLSTNTRVAVKFFSPYIQLEEAQLQRYCRLLQSEIFADIEAMADCVEAGIENDFAYIASNYYNGEDLHEHLRRVGTLQESKLVEMSLAFASVMATVWDRCGAAHGLIKPGNVLLMNINELMITDFAVYKLLKDTGNWPERPDPDVTPYLSPEQVAGKDYDFRSDMYSVGATLYHLATGAKPISAAEGNPLLGEDNSLFPPANEINPNISSEFAQIFHQLLALEPEQRPHSWHQFAAELRDYHGSMLSTQVLRMREEERVRPEPEPEAKVRKRKPRKKRKARGVVPLSSIRESSSPRWVMPFLMLALAALIIIFGFAIKRITENEAQPKSAEETATEAAEKAERMKELEEAYRKADAFYKQHPEQLERARNMFDEVRSMGLGTKYQELAHERARKIRAKIKARKSTAENDQSN